MKPFNFLFWGQKSNEQYTEHKQEFIQEQYFSTLFILRVFSVILILVVAALFLYIDSPITSHSTSNPDNSGSILRSYLWAVLIVVQLIFTGLAGIQSPKSSQDITAWHKSLVIADSVFLLAWAAALSGTDQLLHGDITIYIIACFAIAAATQFTPAKNIIIYGLSFVVFFIGIKYFQADPDRQVSHYINGFIEVITALVITFVLFRTRVRSFLYRKTIETQKNEMELRVRERTVDLAMANEELRAEIAERKIAEEKMTYLSLHDPLTDLYNRAYFEEEMHRLETGRSELLGLIVCDVDGLKLINDTMGHDKGDEFLIAAADVLKKCFRSSDVVSRVGGDEFAVISTSSEIEQQVDRVRIYLQRHANPHLKALSFSYGYQRYEPGLNGDTLTSLADHNMYEQKKAMKQG